MGCWAETRASLATRDVHANALRNIGSLSSGFDLAHTEGAVYANDLASNIGVDSALTASRHPYVNLRSHLSALLTQEPPLFVSVTFALTEPTHKPWRSYSGLRSTTTRLPREAQRLTLRVRGADKLCPPADSQALSSQHGTLGVEETTRILWRVGAQ